jgi:hypothetical protein
MLTSPSINDVSIRFRAKVWTCTFVESCIAVKVVFFHMIIRFGIRCVVVTLALNLLDL